jgi:hypothetical protein
MFCGESVQLLNEKSEPVVELHAYLVPGIPFF